MYDTYSHDLMTRLDWSVV